MSRWLWIAVGLAVAVAVAAFVELSIAAGRGGEAAPLYSNRRFDPYGSAALYRVMQQRAERVLSLERPRLTKEHRGVMLQILPLEAKTAFDELGDPIDDPYALPTEMLLDWVARGNTLIQITRRRTAVMRELGVAFASGGSTGLDPEGGWAEKLEQQQLKGAAPDVLNTWTVPAFWRSAEADVGPGNRLVLLEAPRPFAVDGPPGWEPRLWNGREAHGGEIAHGQGRVIFVGSPSPALNHGLPRQDNLAWMLELLGRDTVVFDEWAHGIGHGGTVLETLAYFGLVPLLLQAPVWLLFYRWAFAGRRRLPSGVGDAGAEANRDAIDTLARLYHHAWPAAEKRRRVYDEVVHRFADACRCPPDQLETRLRGRRDHAAERALSLLGEAHALATSERPRCVACGYELTGLHTGSCPECGATIPSRVLRLMKRPELAAASPSDPDAGPSPRRSARGRKPAARETALVRILDASSSLAQEL
ncbi:MAG: DUF4350 domain-containing protein [Planctomycetota bacterium]